MPDDTTTPTESGMTIADAVEGAFAAAKTASPVSPSAAPATTPPAAAATIPPPVATPATTPATAPPSQDVWRAKRSQDWAKVHEESQARLQRAVLAETKVKELEGQLNKFNPKLVESLSKERDELRTKLNEVGLDMDPQFNAEFEAKRRTLVNLAKQAAGDKASQIEVLLSAPVSDWRDSQLEGIVGDLSPARHARLMSAMSSLDTLNASRMEQLADAGRVLEQRNLARQQDALRKQRERLATFDATLETWTDPERGQPVFQNREGDQAWNDAVKQRETLARRLYDWEGLSDTDKAEAAIRAASFDSLVESHLATSQEVDRLKAELAKWTGAVPPPPGGEGGAPPLGDEDANLDYATAIMKGLKRHGLMPQE